MYTPAAKRRRIETASQTLAKPFKSPFKTPFKSPVKDGSPSTPAPLGHKSTNSLLAENKTPALPSSANLTPNPASRKKKAFTSPIATAALNADPEVATLLKQQRELERELRDVKEELDTAEQARKIERDSEKRDPGGVIDGELIELMGKWRGASRMAAEELFGKVRDRINSMGGPRAFKEMQKRQQEYQGNWDQENNNENDENNEVEGKEADKRDLYAEYGEPETENERGQREKGVGDTGENPGEEDEFTMAMMLRTLNVDLDIIGYDREAQRWVD